MSLSTTDEIEQSCPPSIPGILADFFLKKIEMGSYSSDSDYKHKGKKKKSKHKKEKHKKSKRRYSSKSSSSSRDGGYNRKDEVDDVSSSEEKSIKRLKKIKTMKLNPANNIVLPCVASKPTEDEAKLQCDPCSSSAIENLVFYGPSLELLLSGVESHSPNSKLDPHSKVISPEHNDSIDLKDNISEIEISKSCEDGKIKEENVLLPKYVNIKSESCLDTGLNNTSDNDILGNLTLHESDSIIAKETEISKYSNKAMDGQKSNAVTTALSNENEKSHVELLDGSRNDFRTTLSFDSVEKDTLNESAKENTASSEEKVKSETNLYVKRETEEAQQKIEENKHNSRSRSRSRSKFATDDSSKLKHKKKLSRSRSSSRESTSRKKRKCSLEKSHDKRSHSRSPLKCKKSRSRSPRGRSRDRSHSTRRRHSRSKSRRRSLSRHKDRSLSRSRHRDHSSSRSRRKDRSSSRSKHKDYSPFGTRQRDRSSSRSRRNDHLFSRSRYKDRSSSRSRHKDRSSSRSRHKDHSSSRSRHKDRSSSRSRYKDRSSSRPRHRERSSSRSRHKNLSSSKSGQKSKSRSRSRSKSKSRNIAKSDKASHSRSRSKEKNDNKIDQVKILETARRNVLKMMKNGTLPDGLAVENLKKEQLISIQSGGKSVQELTDFCQRLSQKENDPDDDGGNDDGADDENGFIHHPFKVKEPAMIKLNIKNAVQLPIKTHAQKIAETTRLSSQFPVSSGNQHKQKELEWIPVVPEPPKTESKSVEKKTSTNKNSVTTVAVIENKVSPTSSAPQVPVSYPCASEVPQVAAIPVPPLIPPPTPPQLLPPPMPPTVPTSLQELPTTTQPEMHHYTMPNNQQMIMPNVSVPVSMPTPIIMPSTSVFRTPRKIDIHSIVTKRFQALTILQQNPNDPEALAKLQEAQEDIQDWVQSQQVPGLFTGSTDAKVLSVAELCGPKYYKFRKDYFTHAPPVTGGKGMSLLKKMGWNPGEGLGKNKEGSLEPLVLDIKMDKKGLVGEGENSKKGACSFTKELQGKHPVSALMELCSKRRWKPPLYTCIMDHGPSHKKQFCFKVEVNGVEYQPLNPVSNKKVAKADAAVICLQALNVFPKIPS